MKNIVTEWLKTKQRAALARAITETTSPKLKPALMMQLEPRIMFDGAAAATAVEVAHADNAHAAVGVDNPHSAGSLASVASALPPVVPATTNDHATAAPVAVAQVAESITSETNKLVVDSAATLAPVTEV